MRNIKIINAVTLVSLLFLASSGIARALTMQEIFNGQAGQGQVLGSATPAFVQGQTAIKTNVSLVPVTFTSSVTAGNLIAVAVFWSSTSVTLNSVTAGCVGGNFTLINNPVLGSGWSAGQGYAAIAVSGACTITANFSGSVTRAVIVTHEIGNINTGDPLDGSAISYQNYPGSSTDAVSSGSINVAYSGDYIFGATVDGNLADSVWTAGTGFTGQTVIYEGLSEGKIQPSVGPVAATFTSSKSLVKALTGIMAFEAAGAQPPSGTAPIITSFTAAPSSIIPGNSASLSWSVSGNPIPTLSINNGIGTVTGSSISVSPSLTTTYTLTADNSEGSTTANATVTVTAAPPLDTAPPSVPANLSASAVSSSQINLSWTASTDDVAVTGYKIYRNGSQIGTGESTSYSDTNLSPSTAYAYTVSAYDAAGNNSAQSAAASATTLSSAVTPTILFSDDAEQGIIGDSSVWKWWYVNHTGFSVTKSPTHSGQYSYVSSAALANTDSPITTGTDPLYVKAWIYVPSNFVLPNGTATNLFGLNSHASWLGYYVGLTNSNGTYYLRASGINGIHPFTTNTWHAVEMVYNNTAHTVSVFLNGNADISATGVTTEVKDHVVLYTTAGTGNIYFDDITVSNVDLGNPTSGLNVRHAYPTNRTAMKVQAYLWGANPTDKLVGSIDGTNFSAISNPGGYQEPVLNLVPLSAGDHTLRMQLQTDDGTPRSTYTETITAYGGTPMVAIDENNNLVSNGHKIFPITPWFQSGLQTAYWYQQGYVNAAGWATQWQSTYSTATFYNWLHGANSLNYDSTGIRAMGPFQSRMGPDGSVSTVALYAQTFKNDPALLAWVGYDEASYNGIPYQTMQDMMNAIHANDNNHPFIYDDATVPYLHIKDWYYPNLVADIYSTDDYPTCFNVGYTNWVQKMDRDNQANYNLLPNFNVLELYKFTGGTNWNCQPLTGQRIYNEAWLSIIHGRKGLSWYDNGSVSGNAYAPTCTNDTNVNCFPPNPVGHIGKVVSQVARITPDVILAAPTGRTVASNQTSNCAASPYVEGHRVDVTVREDNNNIWVFAARLTDPVCGVGEEAAPALSTTFTVSGLSGAAVAGVLDESRTVPISGGAITDNFAPYQVHIYQISKSGTNDTTPPAAPTGVSVN
jgi:hypothetical protein